MRIVARCLVQPSCRCLKLGYSARAASTASSGQRIAVVTGGAQGLGEAISRALAENGDKVVVVDIKGEMGKNVAKTIDGEFLYCDVTDAKSVQNTMETVASRHGSVDVVVANAGVVTPPTAVHAITDETWKKVNDVNGFGTFLTVKHSLRQMLKQPNGGVILGLSSVCGVTGHSGTSPYNFAKAGIISLTKTVAIEYRKHNIRMNCLCPATSDTPMVRIFLEHSPPKTKELLFNLSPVPGLIESSHVAQAAVFLCSPNKYVTGVALPVDGGYLSAYPHYKEDNILADTLAKENS